ncbi:MAG TPA: ATP-binding cassette domain-containing protein, partial [Candidatus Absconditabacterales bacterium]|nr:ATP-binding cassette domain-containing protein [Candidatus Absconditabacterales bacterium]
SLTDDQLSEKSKTQLEEIFWQALENVGLKKTVEEMPKKLESKLGEKGIKLSGGERQRLALARIVIKNPEIILLDEPTSALDSISENLITETMKKITANKTMIILAHRLQTVMHADTIVVLEKGKIIQEGSHKELIEKEGTYKTLVDLQNEKITE